MNKEEFILSVTNLGINVTETILEKLEIYCNFLLEYNKHTNLTAIKEVEDVYLKHFYDSLTITKVIDLKRIDNLLDIGSGAGFPGLVLKIFYPNLRVTLVDANNKKTKFLEAAIKKLNVDNITVINKRIEDITPQYLNSFDVVTARAVTNLTVLTELAIPLVKKDKYFIAMKGSNTKELEEGKYAIAYLNCQIAEIATFELSENAGIRNIIKIKKLQATNLKDLRTYDKIIKKPLKK